MSKNLHFDRFLLSIACKVSARKVQKSYLSWYWGVVQEKLAFLKKIAWEIWWSLLRALGSIKIYTLMSNFCQKYVMFEVKKIQRSCVMKNDLCFQEQDKEFYDFLYN